VSHQGLAAAAVLRVGCFLLRRRTGLGRLLAKADVGAVSRQLELALLYDGKLDVRAMA
jgi:hypothetical protein